MATGQVFGFCPEIKAQPEGLALAVAAPHRMSRPIPSHTPRNPLISNSEQLAPPLADDLAHAGRIRNREAFSIIDMTLKSKPNNGLHATPMK